MARKTHRSGKYNLRIWKKTPAWQLAQAVKWQDTAKIARIAKAHPELLNYQEPRYGATLLIWAVGVEKYKSAEALLQCGSNPNIRTTRAGETALFIAADYSWVPSKWNTDPKFVKLLLQYGADPNICYAGGDPESNVIKAGTSPLMRSIGCSIDKTKALVEGGANINYKTANGMTAAILALWEGGPNAPEEKMEYAFYVIAEKKASITEPWR